MKIVELNLKQLANKIKGHYQPEQLAQILYLRNTYRAVVVYYNYIPNKASNFAIRLEQKGKDDLFGNSTWSEVIDSEIQTRVYSALLRELLEEQHGSIKTPCVVYKGLLYNTETAKQIRGAWRIVYLGKAEFSLEYQHVNKMGETCWISSSFVEKTPPYLGAKLHGEIVDVLNYIYGGSHE